MFLGKLLDLAETSHTLWVHSSINSTDFSSTKIQPKTPGLCWQGDFWQGNVIFLFPSGSRYVLRKGFYLQSYDLGMGFRPSILLDREGSGFLGFMPWTLIYRAPCYIYTVASFGGKKNNPTQPNLNKKKHESSHRTRNAKQTWNLNKYTPGSSSSGAYHGWCLGCLYKHHPFRIKQHPNWKMLAHKKTLNNITISLPKLSIPKFQRPSGSFSHFRTAWTNLGISTKVNKGFVGLSTFWQITTTEVFWTCFGMF